ncbi:di-trans,poly-cis-decaprenylcistransferase [Candidatus Daviesbacteria bacterium]|nr:di-trans,poly-cis-decaprenylcistransferase [Candidatus Daviesbacteria bacterium]
MATPLDTKQIPQHIAIIMDGNRRWAKKHNLPPIKGHEAGSEALERIVEAAAKLGVKTLTVYALSTENIRERTIREVKGLFDLMRRGYQTKIQNLMKNGVKVAVLGEIEGLPKNLQKIIADVKHTYIQNESIKLNIALNYGGK